LVADVEHNLIAPSLDLLTILGFENPGGRFRLAFRDIGLRINRFHPVGVANRAEVRLGDRTLTLGSPGNKKDSYSSSLGEFVELKNGRDRGIVIQGIKAVFVELDLTASLPTNWGTTKRSAYSGKEFLIRGVDGITGTNQMLALLDGSGRTLNEVTNSLPPVLSVHALDGHDGYFLIGGQIGPKAFLARYREGTHFTDLSTLLPEGTVDVTAVRIVGSKVVAAGFSRTGQLLMVVLERN